MGLGNTVTWRQPLAKTDGRHLAVSPQAEFVQNVTCYTVCS